MLADETYEQREQHMRVEDCGQTGEGEVRAQFLAHVHSLGKPAVARGGQPFHDGLEKPCYSWLWRSMSCSALVFPPDPTSRTPGSHPNHYSSCLQTVSLDLFQTFRTLDPVAYALILINPPEDRHHSLIVLSADHAITPTTPRLPAFVLFHQSSSIQHTRPLHRARPSPSHRPLTFLQLKKSPP